MRHSRKDGQNMATTRHIQSKYCRQKSQPSSNGFALPLVIAIGTLLMISGFAILARTVNSLRGSIRNSQQTQAQENAERGVERMLQQLNQPSYRYLWVNCYQKDDTFSFEPGNSCSQASIVGGWNNAKDEFGGEEPKFMNAICSASSITEGTYSDNLKVSEVITPRLGNTDSPKANRGNWSLEKYTFIGNPYTGGRGILQVSGTRTNKNGEIVATAVIEHHVRVHAKPCNKKISEKHGASAFPGLLAKSIDLQNSDVIGGTAEHSTANIYCTGCDDVDDIKQNERGSVVDGQLIVGELKLPPVPRFPRHLLASVKAGNLTFPRGGSQISIKAPPESNQGFHPTCSDCQEDDQEIMNASENPDKKPMCATDAQGVGHCLINDITLTGQKSIVVDTAEGERPIRIYLSGDLKHTGGGNRNDPNTGNIEHRGGGPLDFAIFSTKTSCSTVERPQGQTITIAGTSSLQAFIYAPCATVKINGGANQAICTTATGEDEPFDGQTKNDPTLPCRNGDINGAVWAGHFDGNGQKAEITVPEDLHDDLVETFGDDFSVGASEFVGVGITDWRSYQN